MKIINKELSSTAIVSVSPVVLPAPNRPVNLQMRISAPVTGEELPIILLSHGHGDSNYLSSMLGCAPLADFWAAHGFVVIQPTHLNSKTVNVDRNGPEGPLFWRSRVEDMKFIIDKLDDIESIVPALSGRLDKTRIAVAGYSVGGHTAAMLLGMRMTHPSNEAILDMSDSRIKAGVLLAAPGKGSDLTPIAAEHFPFLRNPNFAEMITPALVVNGDKDVNPKFTNRTDWRADAYTLSKGSKCMLTVFGAQHSLGGVSGYDAAETSDENPATVASIQQLTWAYLRTALYPEDNAWATAQESLVKSPNPLGKVECK